MIFVHQSEKGLIIASSMLSSLNRLSQHVTQVRRFKPKRSRTTVLVKITSGWPAPSTSLSAVKQVAAKVEMAVVVLAVVKVVGVIMLEVVVILFVDFTVLVELLVIVEVLVRVVLTRMASVF